MCCHVQFCDIYLHFSDIISDLYLNNLQLSFPVKERALSACRSRDMLQLMLLQKTLSDKLPDMEHKFEANCSKKLVILDL